MATVTARTTSLKQQTPVFPTDAEWAKAKEIAANTFKAYNSYFERSVYLGAIVGGVVGATVDQTLKGSAFGICIGMITFPFAGLMLAGASAVSKIASTLIHDRLTATQ